MSVENLILQLDKLDQKDLNILGCLLQTLRSKDEFFPFTPACKLNHSQDWERSDFLHYFFSVKEKVDEYEKKAELTPFVRPNIKLRACDLAVEASIIMSTLSMAKMKAEYLSKHNELV